MAVSADYAPRVVEVVEEEEQQSTTLPPSLPAPIVNPSPSPSPPGPIVEEEVFAPPRPMRRSSSPPKLLKDKELGDGRHKIVKKVGRFKVEAMFDPTDAADRQRMDKLRAYVKKRRSSVF